MHIENHDLRPNWTYLIFRRSLLIRFFFKQKPSFLSEGLLLLPFKPSLYLSCYDRILLLAKHDYYTVSTCSFESGAITSEMCLPGQPTLVSELDLNNKISACLSSANCSIAFARFLPRNTAYCTW